MWFCFSRRTQAFVSQKTSPQTSGFFTNYNYARSFDETETKKEGLKNTQKKDHPSMPKAPIWSKDGNKVYDETYFEDIAIASAEKAKTKTPGEKKKSDESTPIRKSDDDDIKYESVGETKEGTGEKIKEKDIDVSAATNKAKELWETTQEMLKETAKDVKDTYGGQISEGTQKIKDMWEGVKKQDVKEFVEKKTEEATQKAKELYNEASEKGWTKMASEKIAQAKESLKKSSYWK